MHQLRKLNKDYYPQPILQKRAENGVMHWNAPAKQANEHRKSQVFRLRMGTTVPIALMEAVDATIDSLSGTSRQLDRSAFRGQMNAAIGCLRRETGGIIVVAPS